VTVLRRSRLPKGRAWDEEFTSALEWRVTDIRLSAERGDLTYEFIEISEEEADRLVENWARVRRECNQG
jgi:hypothetical protein